MKLQRTKTWFNRQTNGDFAICYQEKSGVQQVFHMC